MFWLDKLVSWREIVDEVRVFEGFILVDVTRSVSSDCGYRGLK